MKKLLSLLLTIVMVMSVVAVVTPVSADTTNTDNLLFSLDLSGYDSESNDKAKGIKDGASDPVKAEITLPEDMTNLKVEEISHSGKKYLDITDAQQMGLTVTDTAVNERGQADITLEMWTMAKGNTAATYMDFPFVLTKVASGSRQNLRYGRSGTQLQFECQYDPSNQKNVIVDNVEQTKWTHWVVVRTYNDAADSGTLTVYMNGDEKGTAAQLNGVLGDTTDAKMFIGSGLNPSTSAWGRAFVGGIGACNVYGKALTAEEVKAKYFASGGEYYELDNTGLIFSMDLSGYDSAVAEDKGIKDSTADLVVEEIITPDGITVETVPGKQTKYLKISNTQQVGLKVKDSAVEERGRKDVTLEMWTRAKDNTAAGNMDFAFTLHNGSKHNLKYARAGTSIYFDSDYSNSGQARVEVKGSEQTEWTHWVLTRAYNETTNEGTLTAYRNGNQWGNPVPINGELPDTSTDTTMYIGAAPTQSATWGNSFVGDIGACNIYNKELTAAEVKAKFNASAGDFYNLDNTGLVFDMDLSGYSTSSGDTGKGIVDATADLIDEKLTLGAGTTVEPISAGSDIKALKLTAATTSGLKVEKDNGIDEAASSDTMTVETWMKVSDAVHTNAEHAFLYTSSSAAHNWQIMPDVTEDKDGNKSMTVTNQIHENKRLTHSNINFNEWAHYVFTREYDTDEQTCTLTIYVNGVQKDQQVLENISGPQTMSGGVMHIGGGTFSTAIAMDGEMATFKVYNRAMGESEAYSKYVASANGFGHTVEEGFSLANINWTPAKIGGATTAVSVDFRVVNTTEEKELFCVLAVYDENENMVVCDVDTEVTVGGDEPIKPVYLSVEGLTPAPGYFARIYVWGKGTLEPLTDGSDKIEYPAVVEEGSL